MFLYNFLNIFFWGLGRGRGGLEQYKTQETSLMIERDDTAQNEWRTKNILSPLSQMRIQKNYMIENFKF